MFFKIMFLINSFNYRFFNLFTNLTISSYKFINFYFLTNYNYSFFFFSKNISGSQLFLLNVPYAPVSSVFVNQTKSPLFLNLKKLNLRRNFLLYRKFLFKLNLKFTKTLIYSLWIDSKKTNKNDNFILKKSTPSLPFSSVFIKNFLFIFLKPWHYLCGKAVSPYNWDLFGHKNIFKIPHSHIFNKNNNYYFKKLRTSDSINFKKFFINNFFYFNKYKINYSNLSHFIKLHHHARLKTQRNSFLVKPYFFLNNHDNLRISTLYINNLTINTYKNYLKFFSNFRRFLYFSKIKKNYDSFFKNNLITNTSFFSKYFTQLNTGFMDKKFTFYRNFSFFLDKKNKPNSRAQLVFTKTKKKKLMYVWFSCFLYKNFKNKFLKKNNLLLNSSSFFNKHFYDLRFYFLNTVRPKYVKRIKKIFIFSFFYKNFRSSSVFNSFKKKNTMHIKNRRPLPSYFHTKHCYRFFLSSLRSPNNFTSVFNTTIKKKKLLKNRVPNKILFYSKEKTNFLLPFNGFLFINNFSSLKHTTKFSYNLKKFFYSFLRKNETQRFILKRYTKTNFLTTFTADASSLLINFFKPIRNSSVLNENSAVCYSHLKKNNNAFFILNQNLFASSSCFYFNEQINAFKSNYNDDSNFIIKRTRFKPGYMSIWREVREVLKTTLSLKFKYQYKLTNYLSKYKKFINFKTFLINEFKLVNIIIQSKILLDEQIIQLFLNSNLIYLNGMNVFNKNIQIFVGDFIQLLVSLKYYILFKWFLNLSFKKKIKLKKIAKKKFFYSHDTEEKKKSYSLPQSILFNKYFFEDIIKYLEVDYFTLSMIVLYEPFLWSDLNNFNLFEQKFSIINLYNWKYIT